MITDYQLSFSMSQALTGTSATNSTNVADMKTAVTAFAGGTNGRAKLAINVSAAGGTTPTFTAAFVGADSADLATNPITLASTGTTGAITAGQLPLQFELTPSNQTTAKRYYGLVYTLGGTAPTATVAAHFVESNQNNGVR